jgi:uncharacterized membrane protein YedE/YeeE
MRRWRTHVEMGGLGLAFGATLSAAGFTDYGELHRMFTLADPRLLLTFAAAVGLAWLGFALLCRGDRPARRSIQAGTIPGAAVFGAGWALCGGCPGALLAMLGEGKLAALLTLGGVLLGTALGHRLKGWLRWDSGSCAS